MAASIPVPAAPSAAQLPDSYDELRDSGVPVVIDNGATHFRWGFASSSNPKCAPNVVTKYKERKTNNPILLFGEAVELDSTSRSQVKYPWESDILLNFDALESSLDYAFLNMGIDTSSIQHPVLMSERLCTPLHSRSLTSELLFELYNVPSATYCIDSPMSFYQNCSDSSAPWNSDGLIISFNTSSTSVIPMLNGKGILSFAKRMPWGASQASNHLLKLVQMKYPTFSTRVTPVQSTYVFQTFTEFALDYRDVARTLRDPVQMQAAEKIIQFPFSVVQENEKTEEELALMAERRREQGRRLQEMAAAKRLEKLAQKENDLAYLHDLKDACERQERESEQRLRSEGFESQAALLDAIKKLESDLRRAKKKEVDQDEITEEPNYPLLDVPDEELDEESLKEKRRQKLLKAGAEARAKARKEKERAQEERDAEERKENEEREADLVSWSRRLKTEQQALISKIRDRGRRKAALTDRKSAAAQARMKNIASLASDERMQRKRRKNDSEDMFGADDADWAIYRKINVAAPSSDEEEELSRLDNLEQRLLQYDPSFSIDQTYAALSAKRSALLSAFQPSYQDGDAEGRNRIHLSTERWRVCESWFNPGMAGIDSAGLGEILQGLLSGFSEKEKARMVKNVFVTGAPSHLSGLRERLYGTLRPILPPEMRLEVSLANEPALDAWKGMARFAKTDGFRDVLISRADYDEWGGERIKRWWGSNWVGT